MVINIGNPSNPDSPDSLREPDDEMGTQLIEVFFKRQGVTNDEVLY